MNVEWVFLRLLGQLSYGEGIYGDCAYNGTGPCSLPNTSQPWQWQGLVLVGLLFLGAFLLFRSAARHRQRQI